MPAGYGELAGGLEPIRNDEIFERNYNFNHQFHFFFPGLFFKFSFRFLFSLSGSVHGLLDTSQCEVCYLFLAGFLKTLQPKLRLFRPN